MRTILLLLLLEYDGMIDGSFLFLISLPVNNCNFSQCSIFNNESKFFFLLNHNE
jgi:hypothetical protein